MRYCRSIEEGSSREKEEQVLLTLEIALGSHYRTWVGVRAGIVWSKES